MRRAFWLMSFMSLGCGSEPLVLPARPVLHVDGDLPRANRSFGTLYRDEVERAVRAGLGHFLQLVELRAVTQADDGGRRSFVGFEIVALRPAFEWLAFDFAPGDIVTQIEGVSVEHYNSVIPVFEGLSKKDKLEVSIIRAGEPKTVLVSIRDRAASN